MFTREGSLLGELRTEPCASGAAPMIPAKLVRRDARALSLWETTIYSKVYLTLSQLLSCRCVNAYSILSRLDSRPNRKGVWKLRPRQPLFASQPHDWYFNSRNAAITHSADA